MTRQSGSSIIRRRLNANNNNSQPLCPPEPNPPMLDSSDYEIQVHVNFESRELRLLKVIGAAEGADVFLFMREKCQPDCADANCRNCKSRKLYQDKAADPQGTVPYTPNQEYLYCLRFDKQPITALLALTPREQEVDVQEKGVLAYWLMRWLERAKSSNPTGAVAAILSAQSGSVDTGGSTAQSQPPLSELEAATKQDDSTAPPPPPPPPPAPAAEEPVVQTGFADDINAEAEPQQPPTTTSEDCLHKNTSAYLPNMQVIYQVKKDQMSIVLPKPEQLTRPIDVILVTNEEGNGGKQQAISLMPGDAQSNNNLIALRNTAYTLRVQLHGKGRPVDLLDFITEQKILRVQESKDAPKQLNFLMERLIEQRGTFVLHITFDEKIVEVGTKPIGEFYLDVDVDAHRMMIGTIESHASKHYRVERVNKESNANVLLADKQLVFEGGVDPKTLSIRESIPIERMSDYLITVVDPATKQALPTSLLAFQKNALFVKEIKNSEVRLHVTVQRQPTVMSQSSNANNRRQTSPILAVGRRDPTSGAIHCPFRSGWSCFRIHHATLPASPAGDPDIPQASCSLVDSLDTAETATTATPQLSSVADTLSSRWSCDSAFSLDVDLPSLKARLLPASQRQQQELPRNILFIIYEESYEGKLRSTPCHLGQAFKVKHWCKYTVKCVEENSLSPLLTFRITDEEVTELRACSASVRLTKRFVQEVA